MNHPARRAGAGRAGGTKGRVGGPPPGTPPTRHIIKPVGLDEFVTSISVMKRIVLRSLLAALVLHGVFTIGLPWLLLRASSVFPALFPEIGPARHLGFAAIALGAVLYTWSAAELLWVSGVSASPFAQPQFLRTTGCYGRVRNPLLPGVALLLLAAAVVLASMV